MILFQKPLVTNISKVVASKTRMSAMYYTSTRAFELVPIQKETEQFCKYLNIVPVHINYDKTHNTLFINTYNEAYYVIDLMYKTMSAAIPTSPTIKKYYSDIARTKDIRLVTQLLYDAVKHLDMYTSGSGTLEFSRENKELAVAMRFDESEELALNPSVIPPPLTYIKLTKNSVHTEYNLVDEISHIMFSKATSPPRPIKHKANERLHNW